APEGLLGVGAECAEAHAGDGDGNLEVNGFLGEARADGDVGAASLAVALERIARHRSAEENEVVEARQMALGAIAADLIEALVGGAVYFRQDMLRKRVGGTQATGIDAHRKAPGRNGSIGVGVIDVEIVEAARRTVASKLLGVGLDARPCEQTPD